LPLNIAEWNFWGFLSAMSPLRLSTLVIIGLLVSGFFPELTADTELNYPGYRIEWRDEFEGTTVDSSKWDVNLGVNASYQRESDGLWVEPHWFNEEFEPWINAFGINSERQYYSPDNVTVEDGLLVIRADRESVLDPIGLYDPEFHEYTSGKLNTADEFQFQYGIVKWRAQLPAGQGLWPALWMLNAPDPWYWDDEIDVMEARGSKPTHTSSAHHFKVLDDGGNRQNIYNSSDVDLGVNLQTGFHEYGLQWTADSVRTWVDDWEILFDTQRIPQNPMFLIMNAAVGGGFDGDPGPDTVFPTYFMIDWVRVWQHADTPTDLANGGFEDQLEQEWADWNTVDDGNLSAYSVDALHGDHSVQIDYRAPESVEPDDTRGPDLMTDGTASEWRGYLNQLTSDDAFIEGGPVDPSTIPATADGDALSLSTHQSAPAPQANSVVFREIAGEVAQGRNLTFSGTVNIEEAFPEETKVTAFIRIFDSNYNLTDIEKSVKADGGFSIQAFIPASGVPIVHIGLQTTGATGSGGRVTATELYLEEDASGTSGNGGYRTGFIQTVMAVPGQPVQYGLLAANHPDNPIGEGAVGHLLLEFLNENDGILAEESTTIVDASSTAEAMPYLMEMVAPANAVYARLSIERITTDAELDTAGSFLVDAAFLHDPETTELPVISAQPPASLTVTAGESVELDITVNSPTELTYQWYHLGQKVGTEEDLSFTAMPDASGTYFVVAANEAGPVIGGVTNITVVSPVHVGPVKLINVEWSNGQIHLSFESMPGATYVLEGSYDLEQWQTVGSPLAAEQEVSTFIESLPVTDPPLRFFRITSAR